MLKNLLYLIILLAGIPAGHYLMHLAKDEIKAWRGRLIVMAFISAVAAVIVYFYKLDYSEPIIVGLLFIVIVCMVIIRKSK
jgi:hypothetical protein